MSNWPKVNKRPKCDRAFDIQTFSLQAPTFETIISICMSVIPQQCGSNFEEHIDKLLAELAELRPQMANSRLGAELEAIWNESRGTPPGPPNMHTKASILLSRRAIALLESKLKEKEEGHQLLGGFEETA